jgi:hypothetical protein
MTDSESSRLRPTAWMLAAGAAVVLAIEVDGRIRSLPILQSRIDAAAQVTMGSGAPAQVEAEAHALVAALHARVPVQPWVFAEVRDPG